MSVQKKSKMQKKNLDSSPDDTRTFEKGKVNIANFEDIAIGKAILEPGWSGKNVSNQ